MRYESIVKDTVVNLSKVRADIKSTEIELKDKFQTLSLDLFDFKSRVLKLIKPLTDGRLGFYYIKFIIF